MVRLKTVWHLLNLPCRDMTRLASESLDRDLGRLERLALKSHLLYCISCRRWADSSRTAAPSAARRPASESRR